jgi:rod shape determining protein RodA
MGGRKPDLVSMMMYLQKNIRTTSSIDWVTVLLYALLVLMGWLNIYAAVYDDQYSSILSFSQRYGKQLIWIIAACGLALSVSLIDSKLYSIFAWVIYGASLFLLLLVLLVGTEINGARSWIMISGMQLQPTEFAKIGTCLAIARLLGRENAHLKDARTMLRIFLVLAAPMGLILLQPDAGSALIYFAFLLVLYREGLPGWILAVGVLAVLVFILVLVVEDLVTYSLIASLGFILYMVYTRKIKASIRFLGIFSAIIFLVFSANQLFSWELPVEELLAWIILVSSGVLAITGIFIKNRKLSLFASLVFGVMLYTTTVDYVFANFIEPHQQQRLHILLGLEEDPLGYGYNVNQSKIAIGSGGFWGKGYLQGTQTKFNFVPEQSTDFIFCTVGEEWGFVGSLVVLGLYLFLLSRILFLAERQRSTFSRVYGYGVASLFFLHFLVNVGMSIGLLPVIGIPLPFFSYGGSSLWAFTILLFILLRLDSSRLELIW